MGSCDYAWSVRNVKFRLEVFGGGGGGVDALRCSVLLCAGCCEGLHFRGWVSSTNAAAPFCAELLESAETTS